MQEPYLPSNNWSLESLFAAGIFIVSLMIGGVVLNYQADQLRYRNRLCREASFLVNNHTNGLEGVYEQLGMPYEGQAWDCGSVPLPLLEELVNPQE